MKNILLFIIFILLATSCFRTEKIKIYFVDENGTALTSGKFYLYQFKKGAFEKAIFKDYPITEGKIELEHIPQEGLIGFDTDNEYYRCSSYYKDSSKIIKNNEIKLKAKKSGIIKVNMTKKYFFVDESCVIPYFMHLGKKILMKGGISAYLDPGSSFKMVGIRPGKYHFEIKDSYKNTATVFYKSKVINVVAGKTTVVNDVELGNLKPTVGGKKIRIYLPLEMCPAK